MIIPGYILKNKIIKCPWLVVICLFHLYIFNFYWTSFVSIVTYIYLSLPERNSSNIQLWNTTSSYSVEKVQVKLLKYISMVHIQNIYHLYLLNKFGNSSLNHPLLNGGIFNNHIRNSWMFWINNDANCHPSPVRNENHIEFWEYVSN